jgi:hypothetical protein
MTLHIEAINPVTQQSQLVGVLKPGDRPGSVSQNLPDGGREIYLFQCMPDNSSSKIQKSKGGMDIANSQMREIVTEGLQDVVILRENESYTLTLFTDISSVRGIMQFTHKIP